MSIETFQTEKTKTEEKRIKTQNKNKIYKNCGIITKGLTYALWEYQRRKIKKENI